MAALKDLKPHLIQALRDGKSIHWQGQLLTLKDFDDVPPEAVNYKVEVERLEARLAELESALVPDGSVADVAKTMDDLAKRAEDAEAVLEAIAPTSKTELERMNVEAIKAYAAYRGLTVDGKDKAALVADLLAIKGGS